MHSRYNFFFAIPSNITDPLNAGKILCDFNQSICEFMYEKFSNQTGVKSTAELLEPFSLITDACNTYFPPDDNNSYPYHRLYSWHDFQLPDTLIETFRDVFSEYCVPHHQPKASETLTIMVSIMLLVCCVIPLAIFLAFACKKGCASAFEALCRRDVVAPNYGYGVSPYHLINLDDYSKEEKEGDRIELSQSPF